MFNKATRFSKVVTLHCPANNEFLIPKQYVSFTNEEL